MRVISGRFRNRNLKVDNHLRPTTDRVRETLFNILQNEIEGSVFVDAFAGSGAVGIEALSRGAASVYFIESNNRILKTLESNLIACGEDNHWRIFSMAVMKGLDVIREMDPSVSLLFFDPPYQFKHYSELLLRSVERFPAATHILELSTRTKFVPPESVELVKDRRIGETLLSFYRRDRREL